MTGKDVLASGMLTDALARLAAPASECHFHLRGLHWTSKVLCAALRGRRKKKIQYNSFQGELIGDVLGVRHRLNGTTHRWKTPATFNLLLVPDPSLSGNLVRFRYTEVVISDSIPWRTELARIASRLERKSRQDSWSDRSTFRTEKDLMLAGYAIRRLVEARKLADSLVAAQVPVFRYPRVGVIPDAFNKEDIDKHYALDAPVKSRITLGHLCNQLIHSYILMHSFEDIVEPVEQEDGTILDGVRYFNGVFVASEHERYKHVYFFPLDVITTLCRKIATEDIVGVDMRRDKNGLMQIIRVFSSADEDFRLVQGH